MTMTMPRMWAPSVTLITDHCPLCSLSPSVSLSTSECLLTWQSRSGLEPAGPATTASAGGHSRSINTSQEKKWRKIDPPPTWNFWPNYNSGVAEACQSFLPIVRLCPVVRSWSDSSNKSDWASDTGRGHGPGHKQWLPRHLRSEIHSGVLVSSCPDFCSHLWHAAAACLHTYMGGLFKQRKRSHSFNASQIIC